MPRLTKIYTRKGDEGYTNINDKPISKDDLLIEALGTVDELNSCLGLMLSFHIQDKNLDAVITDIQNDLFDLGGELYFPQHQVITSEKTKKLENALDAWNATLPILKEFLLPRGNPKSAACHLARTVCRRAERCIVRLHRQVALNNLEILKYINRLSDLLFVISRLLAKETQEKELEWQHEKSE